MLAVDQRRLSPLTSRSVIIRADVQCWSSLVPAQWYANAADAPFERRPTSIARRESQASEARLRPSARNGCSAALCVDQPCFAGLTKASMPTPAPPA